MRKIVVALFVSVVLLATSSAHPGRTDSAGGHTNHSTGEYHYHHGEPAHQHPNGECPYEIKKTPNAETKPSKQVSDWGTVRSQSTKTQVKKNPTNTAKKETENKLTGSAVLGGAALAGGAYLVFKKKK